MQQRTEEWFAARLGKVTASRVSEVIAKTKSGPSASRENYAVELALERITGRRREGFVSAAMRRGTELEPEARARYEMETGNLVVEVGLIDHPSIPMSGASPDGLIDDDGTQEIKCPEAKGHLTTLCAQKMPPEYVSQVQWQLACTGRQWCDFVSYNPDFPEHLQLIVIRVLRDDAYISTLEAEVTVFQTEIAQIVETIEALQ